MERSTPAVNLLVIRSPDIDRAATFYQRLGLRFDRHAHGRGPEHLASDAGGFVFEIYPQRTPEDATTNVRLGFRVQDVDEAVQSVRELGAEVRIPPATTEWGRRAVVKDLDGHTVELLAPLEVAG